MRWFLVVLLAVVAMHLHAQNGSKETWNRARELMQQQKYAEAISELKKLPRSPEQLYWMAFSASMMVDLQAAEQYASEAVSLEPDWPDSHVLLGDILHLRRKPNEALAEYAYALRIKPANITVLLKMARIEMGLQRFTDAQSRYEEVRVIDPSNVYARLGLAEVFTYRQMWADAERGYNALLKNGKNGDVLLETKIGLARVYAWTKRFSDAERQLAEVLEWKPQTVKALELLAQVYEWSGSYAKAKRTYETILKWQPGHKEAKAKLVELQWVN